MILATLCTLLLGSCGVAGILVAVRCPAHPAAQPYGRDRRLDLCTLAFAESVARGDYATASRLVDLAVHTAAGSPRSIRSAARHRRPDGTAGSEGGIGGASTR
ncbi:MAG: hypothetical protein ACXV5Q_02990 [Frankiaceae bacterium]